MNKKLISLLILLVGYLVLSDSNVHGIELTRFQRYDIGISLMENFKIDEFIGTKGSCFAKCMDKCVILSFVKRNKCSHFSEKAMQYLVKFDGNINHFVKIKPKNSFIGYEYTSFTEDLEYFWPLDSPVELVNGKNISLFGSAKIVSDARNGLAVVEFLHNYGEIPNGIYLNPDEFTFMIWVKQNSDYSGIIDSSSAEGIALYLKIDHKTLTLVTDDAKIGDCTVNYTTNEWYHVALTFQSGEFTIYINSIVSCTFNGPKQMNLIKNENQYYLGNSFGSEDMRSLLSELKIFNRSLTKKEITFEKEKVSKKKVYGQLIHIYEPTQMNTLMPVHYWPMAGSTRDIIGGVDMTVEDGEITDDYNGNRMSAIKFNGRPSTFRFAKCFAENGFTYMFWIKLFSVPTQMQLFQTKSNDDAFLNVGTIVENNNIFTAIFDSSNNKVNFGKFACRTTSQRQIMVGNWIHYAVTFESPGSLTVYYNGAKLCSFMYDGQVTLKPYSLVSLGFGNDDKDRAEVAFDELKIFSKSLSNQEITTQMNIQQPFTIIEH